MLASLNDISVFAAVARTRNFRRAAVELGVSPSALSHALRALEERLGVRLLDRTTRSVTPTEIGERLLRRLEPALREIHGALDSVNDYRDSPIGTLRINAPRAACEWVLVPLIIRFLASYPKIGVELVDNDGLVDIVAEGFDAGVRFGESLQQDMIAIPLGPPQRFVVVASPEFVAMHGLPTEPRELLQYDCIRNRFPNGAFYRWQFEKNQERVDIEVHGPLALGDMRLLVMAAEQSLGLAYVYLQYAQDALAAGRLVSVLNDWRPAETGFFLYFSSRRHMPVALRAFIDFARATFPTNRP